jgi:hypothetical protein
MHVMRDAVKISGCVPNCRIGVQDSSTIANSGTDRLLGAPTDTRCTLQQASR